MVFPHPRQTCSGRVSFTSGTALPFASLFTRWVRRVASTSADRLGIEEASSCATYSVGHYRIIEKIGAGGMAEVYRARDQHLDREVAIKVLPPRSFTDEHARKRFRKEALALSKLNHPNIATIHDFDTQHDLDFLVMEYIPGITLSEKLAARPLTEKEVIA